MVTRKKKRENVESENAQPNSEFELIVENPNGIIKSPSQEPLFWKLKTGAGNFYFLLRKFQVFIRFSTTNLRSAHHHHL